MAIRLAIPAYGCATVVLASFIWHFFLLGGLFSFTGVPEVIFCFVMSLLVLMMTLLWFMAWTGLYSLLLRLLWSSPPQWLRLPKARTLINRDFGILVTAALPMAAIFLTHVGLRVSLSRRLPTLEWVKLIYADFLLDYAWVWFLSAVFLYHGYYQVRAKAKERKRSRRARSTQARSS